VIYADASVIVKRYREETGSARVREAWSAAGRVFTSWVSYAEVHAALARKYRERGLTPTELRTSSEAFEGEWRAYDQIAVDAATLVAVRRLVRRHTLRGFDAIHLAAAVWLQSELAAPVEFWVADERLETAARRERLQAVNPERSLES
jgi:predicted nucleic acid-binding protein